MGLRNAENENCEPNQRTAHPPKYDADILALRLPTFDEGDIPNQCTGQFRSNTISVILISDQLIEVHICAEETDFWRSANQLPQLNRAEVQSVAYNPRINY